MTAIITDNAADLTRNAATLGANREWLKAVGAYNGVARYSAADLDAYAAKVHLHIQSNNAQTGALTARNINYYYAAANDSLTFKKEKAARDAKWAADAAVAPKAIVQAKRTGIRWNSLKVSCPFCGAPVGAGCANGKGGNVRYFHGVRFTLANG